MHIYNDINNINLFITCYKHKFNARKYIGQRGLKRNNFQLDWAIPAS